MQPLNSLNDGVSVRCGSRLSRVTRWFSPGIFTPASAIEGAPESSSASSAESESQLSSQGIEDKYNFPFCTKVSTASSPLDWG